MYFPLLCRHLLLTELLMNCKYVTVMNQISKAEVSYFVTLGYLTPTLWLILSLYD